MLIANAQCMTNAMSATMPYTLQLVLVNSSALKLPLHQATYSLCYVLVTNKLERFLVKNCGQVRKVGSMGYHVCLLS